MSEVETGADLFTGNQATLCFDLIHILSIQDK